MITPKSPFCVFPNLLSPKLCNLIIDDLKFDNVEKTIRTTSKHSDVILDKVKSVLKIASDYYKTEIDSLSTISYDVLSTHNTPTIIHCDNSLYKNNAWIKTAHDRDFTVLIFLSDTCTTVLENDNEVYGGNYEFVTHNFNFTPRLGTVIIHPSGPNFTYRFLEVSLGNLFIARCFIKTKTMYEYDMKNFPGDYKNWFPKK